MKTRILLAALASTALVAGSASAAITVDGTTSFNSPGSPVSGTFNAFGSDKLVAIVTGEHGFNQSANGAGGTATFGGVDMTLLVDRDPFIIELDTDPITPGNQTSADDTFNDIWYLDASAVGGFANAATTFSVNASTRGNVTLIALSGTLDGAGNTVIGNPNSSSADLLTSAGSIVIASYGMGGNGSTAVLGDVTTDTPLVEVSRQANTRSWDGHVTGYANNVAAGTATYSFTDASTTGAHVIAAEFLEVPEPSSLALLGLGTLLIARRRRG